MRARFSSLPKWMLLGLFLFSCVGCQFIRSKKRSDPLPESIRNDISPYKTFDHRPYELIWSGRSELRKPALSFSNLKGWTVESPFAWSADIERSTEQQLWGEFTGRLSLSCLDAERSNEPLLVVMRPPSTLPIADSFDSVSFWLWLSDQQAEASQLQALDLSLLIQKQSNVSERISFAVQGVSGWNFLQKKLADVNESPLALEAISLNFPQGLASKSESLYLDSLNFYREPWNRISLPKDSSSSSDLPGTNRLPFHPPISQEKALLEVLGEGEHTFLFVSTLNGDKLVFKLKTGGTKQSVLEASWNGFPLGNLLQDFGCPEGEKPAEVLSTTRVNDGIRLAFNNGMFALLRLQHRTLSIEINTQHRDIEEFHLGKLQLGDSAQAIPIPFYRLGGSESREVYGMSRPNGKNPIYIHVHFDPAYSGASGFVPASAEEGAMGGHGTLRYAQNTDGIRPLLKERIYISVSSEIQDVLPDLARPGKDNSRSAQANYLWRGGFKERKGCEVAERCSQLSRLGMGNLLLAGGKACWSDGGDSFAYRTQAAPYQGGDQGLSSFVEQYHALGMSVLLYTHLGDLSPLNGLWDEDFIARSSDGSFRMSCGNSFVLKSSVAAHLSTNQVAVLNKKFSPHGFVIDMSCVALTGETTDFDSRVPHAGSFASGYQRFYGLMSSLGTNDQTIVALDGSEWLYADAVHAVKADQFAYTLAELYPLNPIFALARIAPRVRFFGMGDFKQFFKGHALETASEEDRLDRYLCTQVAYGMAGELVDLPDLAMTARSYFMMLEFQALRGSSAPQQIAMHDGKRYRPFSEVLGLGEQPSSHVYVQYKNGLELWVNGSFDADWAVKSGQDEFLLPPSGWLAKHSEGMIYSGLQDGERMDYCETQNMIYIDARGKMQDYRGLQTKDALLIYKPEKVDTFIGWGMGVEAKVSFDSGHRFAPKGGSYKLPSEMPPEAISNGWPLH